MGTPNKDLRPSGPIVEFVLHGCEHPRVLVNTLAKEQLLEIFKEVMLVFTFCMKEVSLADFKPINEALNCAGIDGQRSTDLSKVKFARGVNEDTRFIYLTRLSEERIGNIPGGIGSHGPEIIRTEDIILTQRGELIIFKLALGRTLQENERLAFWEGRYSVRETSETCVFSPVSDETLLALFANRPLKLKNALRRLCDVLQGSIVAMSGRLAKLEKHAAQLRGIDDRIA